MYQEMKKEHLTKAQNNNIANVAGSCRLSLFMDGNGKCKLPKICRELCKTECHGSDLVIIGEKMCQGAG